MNIYSNEGAYAALLDNGSLVVWGGQDWGGNYFPVREQLRSGVSKVFSTRSTFAVLKKNGTVATWGRVWDRESNHYNGKAWEIAHNQSDDVEVVVNVVNVKTVNIFSNKNAYVALKDNGSIVTWGIKEYGADNTAAAAVVDEDAVSHVEATEFAFAALKTNGSVVTWGHSNFGGDSSSVATNLSSGVIQIVSSEYAFSALKSDGSVVTWGQPNR